MVCGAKFDARSANQSYCSKKCKKIGHRNTQKMMRAKAADSASKAVLALPDDTRERLKHMLMEEAYGND
jgi:predicted nucleic acid-binding Zn ribbon protein